MSHQISIIHSEYDIEAFLSEIYLSRGILLNKNMPLEKEDGLKIILSKMNTDSCQLYIAPINMVKTSADIIMLEDTIEFDNTVRGNSLSRTYSVGRLYIRDNLLGQYNSDALHLFTRLRTYIKKNYIYHKSSGVYFAPLFWEKRIAGHWYAAEKNGRVINL